VTNLREIGKFVRKSIQLGLPYRAGEPLEVTLKRAGRAWRGKMRALQDERGLVILPDYPVLSAERMANCRVFPLREDILGLMPKGGVCAEIGVQAGEFSQAILDVCRPAELHLVDIDLATHRVADRFRGEIEAGRVRTYQADSADTLDGFPDGYFDFVYIDADHSHAGVARDIAAAHPKVRAEGFLLFNDYTFWSPAECMPYGVMHAVNEFCIAQDWEIAAYAFNYLGYADIALRRRR
jgi:hypothetical protein